MDGCFAKIITHHNFLSYGSITVEYYIGCIFSWDIDFIDFLEKKYVKADKAQQEKEQFNHAIIDGQQLLACFKRLSL